MTSLTGAAKRRAAMGGSTAQQEAAVVRTENAPAVVKVPTYQAAMAKRTPADTEDLRKAKKGKKRRRAAAAGMGVFPPRHVIVAAANGDWHSTKMLHNLSNLDICEMLRQETGMNYVKHKLSKLHLMSRLFKVFAGKGPYNQRAPRLSHLKPDQESGYHVGGFPITQGASSESPGVGSEEYETSAEEEGGGDVMTMNGAYTLMNQVDVDMASQLYSSSPSNHVYDVMAGPRSMGMSNQWVYPEDPPMNNQRMAFNAGTVRTGDWTAQGAVLEGEQTVPGYEANEMGTSPVVSGHEKLKSSGSLSHVIGMYGSMDMNSRGNRTNGKQKLSVSGYVRSGTGGNISLDSRGSPLSESLPPTPSGMEALRRQRARIRNKMQDTEMLHRVMRVQDESHYPHGICPSGCGRVLAEDEEFCTNCDCYVCNQSSGTKDGSGEWIRCPKSGCRLWVHLECACNRQLAGVSAHVEGRPLTLDASYRCGACGTTVSLLRSIREILEAAHEARIVEILRLKLHLAQRLLKGSERFQSLSLQINAAVQALEMEIGSISFPQGAKDAVRRHSAALKVQAILGNILEYMESQVEEDMRFPAISEDAEAGDISDSECFQCGDGGTLLMCDGVPCKRAFHLDCVGLADVPTGKWLCSSCQPASGSARENDGMLVKTNDSDQSLSPPTELQFADIRPTSVVVKWTAPHGFSGRGVGAITGYKVWHKKVGDSTYGPPPCTPPYMTAVTVTGLEPGTVYVFKVAAVTAAGVEGTATEEARCETAVSAQRPRRKRPTQLTAPSGVSSASQLVGTDLTANAADSSMSAGDGDARVTPETEHQTGAEASAREGVPDESLTASMDAAGASKAQQIKNIRMIRQLMQEGHMTKEIQVKLVSWLTVHASAEQKSTVTVFIEALGEDLPSLAEQLIDAFSEAMNSPPKTAQADCEEKPAVLSGEDVAVQPPAGNGEAEDPKEDVPDVAKQTILEETCRSEC